MEQQLRRTKYYAFFLIGFLLYRLSFAWQTVAPGLNYDSHPLPAISQHSYLHVFRVNLQQNRLSLGLAQEHYVKSSLAAHLAEQKNAPLATNGGFFTPHYKLLGLRISSGQVMNPLRPISWWDVFLVRGTQAKIVLPQYFDEQSHPDFAIQAGPRLLINSKIPNLKPGFAERTALGIDNEGQVLIAVTQQAPIQTQTLARLLQKYYGCVNAINLDGGSSTQLYANFPHLLLNFSNLSTITDAVIVTPR